MTSKERSREENIGLSVAKDEKVKVEQDLEATKKELKEYDHHYLQLSEILECHKKQLSEAESKVTELNVELARSQGEVAHILPQLTAAYFVWG